jgi:hypothetical protein
LDAANPGHRWSVSFAAPFAIKARNRMRFRALPLQPVWSPCLDPVWEKPLRLMRFGNIILKSSGMMHFMILLQEYNERGPLFSISNPFRSFFAVESFYNTDKSRENARHGNG